MNKKSIITLKIFFFSLSVLLIIFPSTIVAKATKHDSKKLPLSVLCQPVQGNETFFGNKPTFNTFHNMPVPLSFRLRGTNKQLENTSLVLYMPVSFKLLDVFQSNKVHEYSTYKTSHKEVIRNGQKYYRFQTTNNLIEPNGVSPYRSRWRACQITVAIDAPDSVKSGEVYWAVEYRGKEYKQSHFTVNFLKPLPVPSSRQQGKFRIMTWAPQTQLAYKGSKLQKQAVDLLQSSGIREVTAFSRFYNTLKSNNNGVRVNFETYLKSRGITLIRQSNAFGGRGPLQLSNWDGWGKKQITLSDIDIPGAMKPNGKRSKKIVSPIPALKSKKFRKSYFKHVRKQLESQPTSKYITFDYEPWAWHNDIGFGKKSLALFSKQFHISKKLTSKIILNKYKKQWTLFWLEISRSINELMEQSVRKVTPNAKIISYSYFRNYRVNPNEQWKQFEACVKDPRQEAKYVDELMLSAYHTHGRKLFNNIRMSQRHIEDANISIIAGLARKIPFQPWVRSKKDALSPQRIYQMAVLCAALGIKRFGIFPGQYIDGAFYTALGKASRLIWAHEDFYYQGKNIHNQVSVSVKDNGKPAKKSSFAYTAQLHDGKVLVSLFNFTNKPLKFIVKSNNSATKQVTVQKNGVKLINLPENINS